MTTFDPVSADYARTAVVQRSAGLRLLERLAIGPAEDVLDLGCGPGNLTRRIRELTAGTVVGLDASAGMIAEARRLEGGRGIEFQVGAAESMDFAGRFDAIFCNSAFQWFRRPRQALRACVDALRAGGRIGLQAPGGQEYCPNFLEAVEALRRDPGTAPVFAAFQSPWFFLDHAADYARLAAEAGLAVDLCRIDRVVEWHAVDALWRVFESGAGTAYLSPEHYRGAWTPGFRDSACERIRAAFERQTGPDGLIEVVFHRLVLLAHKP
jgi:trans-aconitate methyltransferase